MPHRPPVGALTDAERRADSGHMADPTISITDLRIDGQAAVFTIDFTGAPELEAESYLRIYDSSTEMKKEQELYRALLSDVDQHSGTYDLPAGDLGDGDFTVWVEAHLWKRDPESRSGMSVAHDTKGVSFLVGRGRVYPSAEAAPAIDAANVIMIENLRLEGTWVVFDLVNSADHDVSVDHSIRFGRWEEEEFQEMKGRELVNAKATQSAHYLLPEALPDASYTVVASSQIEGAQSESSDSLDFQAHGGALTVVPNAWD
jgi:hypothetical protein